jgi:Leucine-rich repeat (LRR) protein
LKPARRTITIVSVDIPHKRRWFQFSLRTLLLATAFVGLVLAPIVYYRQLAYRQQQIKAELEVHRIRLNGGKEQSVRPNWLKNILGDDSAGLDTTIHVYANRGSISDSALEQSITKLNQLPNVTTLNFADKQISDEELAHFRRLTNIHAVFLDQALVTENGLKYLRGYKNLQTLALLGTQFGDSGVKELANHPNLSTLWLQNTKVTDEGLLELRLLKKLRFLDVSETRITDVGMKNLQGLQTLVDAGVRSFVHLRI